MASLLSVFTQTLVPIFLIIAVSVLLGRRTELRVSTLSRSTLYLFSPALVLNSITHSGMNVGEAGLIIVAAVLGTVILALLATGMARLARLEGALASTFALTIFLMNAGNFGLPFIEFALGEEGLQQAVVYVAGIALTINTLGIYVASRGEGSVRTALRNVVVTPLVYATVAGLLLNVTETALPLPLERAVGLLADAAIPVQLVILGLQLERAFGQAASAGAGVPWRPVALATASRFGLGALVGWAIAALFGFGGVTRQVFILETAMPAGVFSAILSEEFGGDPDFAAATIFVSTLVGSVVLGGLLLWLG